jgi:hypothetical protein
MAPRNRNLMSKEKVVQLVTTKSCVLLVKRCKVLLDSRGGGDSLSWCGNDKFILCKSICNRKCDCHHLWLIKLPHRELVRKVLACLTAFAIPPLD